MIFTHRVIFVVLITLIISFFPGLVLGGVHVSDKDIKTGSSVGLVGLFAAKEIQYLNNGVAVPLTIMTGYSSGVAGNHLIGYAIAYLTAKSGETIKFKLSASTESGGILQECYTNEISVVTADALISLVCPLSAMGTDEPNGDLSVVVEKVTSYGNDVLGRLNIPQIIGSERSKKTLINRPSGSSPQWNF